MRLRDLSAGMNVLAPLGRYGWVQCKVRVVDINQPIPILVGWTDFVRDEDGTRLCPGRFWFHAESLRPVG